MRSPRASKATSRSSSDERRDEADACRRRCSRARRPRLHRGAGAGTVRAEQSAARRVPVGGDGLRSAGGRRRVLEQRQSRDLRHAVQVRLSRAAVQARAQHGGGHARDLGRRQDVDGTCPPRHLLHRRSRVQRAEEGAHRRGLRVRDEARARSQDALEFAAITRRPLRGRGGHRGEGEGIGQVRLRRTDGGLAGARPLHAAVQAQLRRLRASRQPLDRRHRGHGARSHRGVRRWRGLGDGESRGDGPLSPQGMAPRTEDRAGGESRVSRRALSGEQPPGRPRVREAPRQEASARRAHRDQHHRGSIPVCSPSEQGDSTRRAPDLVPNVLDLATS